MPKAARFIFIGFLFTALVWWSTHHTHTVPRARTQAAGQPDILDFPSTLTNDTSTFTGATENATFVMLVRNKELYDAKATLQNLEDRFNKEHGYPILFLNDEEFTQEFREQVTAIVSGNASFGKIPKEQWSYPSWVDQDKALASYKALADDNVIYGGSESYRHMCRFNSGFFFRHPLLDSYKWYWRVEPSTYMSCDVNYDPFTFMRENGKRYGFVITIHEYVKTIPTLWATVKEFVESNPSRVPADNAIDWIVDDNKGLEGDYNMCHFWSNFEIADLDMYRNDAYLAFFDHLDQTGKFFYERWGDAPVHSLFVSLFLKKSELHWFGDFAYFHVPWENCPTDKERIISGRCSCDPEGTFAKHSWSCMNEYWRVNPA